MGQSATELRQDIARTREDLGDTLDAIGDRVSPGRMIERRTNRMRMGFRSIRDRVMGTASATTSSIGDTAHSATERVGDAASEAVEIVRDLPETVRTQSQGNPMLAGGIAFGVGFLAAAALPPTNVERERAKALMGSMPPVSEELSSTVKEVAENLREPAREAATNVKEAASEAARDVAETAKQDVREAAEDTRQQTRQQTTTPGA
jgi:Protein of unknown function (DUF3618)